MANNVKVNIDWVEADTFEGDPEACEERLQGAHAVLVPGGFGERGSEGKIEAARFARERNIPYFGICFGMQMAVIEAARNLAGYPQGVIDRVRPDGRACRGPDDPNGRRATSASCVNRAETWAAPCDWAPMIRP